MSADDKTAAEHAAELYPLIGGAYDLHDSRARAERRAFIAGAAWADRRVDPDRETLAHEAFVAGAVKMGNWATNLLRTRAAEYRKAAGA